jgi:hypothetical protein
MYFGNSSFRKYINAFILPEKEYIKSVTMGSDHTVPSFLTKFLHRQ